MLGNMAVALYVLGFVIAYVEGCGEGLADRIVGGEEADPNSIPWQVGLVSSGASTPSCGGTIICDRFVMTAAHCMPVCGSSSRPRCQVLAGEHDIFNSMDDATTHDIKKIYVHPIYGTSQASTPIDYDYALLELAKPIKLTGDSKARAACLPDPSDENFAAGTKFVVSGWGRRGLDGNLNRPDGKLHHVTVPAVTDAQCRQAYGARLTARMHCAGNIQNGGVDSCQGDSGGPITLVDPTTSKVKLIGVVSWGFGCARKGFPGVYAEVTSVLGWVKNTTVTCADQTSTEEPPPTGPTVPPTDPPTTETPTSCKANDGPANGADCIFPFIFNGVTYNGCTTVQDTRLWCSTSTDSSDNHIGGQGNWGYCNSACPENDPSTDPPNPPTPPTPSPPTSTTNCGGTCDDIVTDPPTTPEPPTEPPTTETPTSCQTNGGANSGANCVFPFTFRGVTYDGCTTVADDQLWCSTLTDSDGVHIGGQGNWGYCSSDCPSFCDEEGYFESRGECVCSEKSRVYWGNTIVRGRDNIQDSVAECQQSCAANNDCEYWSYLGGRRKYCWLKTKRENVRRQRGPWTSGSKNCPVS